MEISYDKIYLKEESEILEKAYNPNGKGIGHKRQMTRKEVMLGTYYSMNCDRLTFTGSYE